MTASAPAVLLESVPVQRERRFMHRLIIAASIAILLARLISIQPLMSSNDISRWMTVWALVERGTYVIDDIHQQPGWHSLDKVRHNGHFYSSKPAMYPTLLAGVYWVVRQITGWNLLTDTAYVVRTILILVNLIPWTLALLLLSKTAERYARTDWARSYIIVAAAFATFLTTFQVTLNNHTIAACNLIFALYPSLRIVTDKSRNPLLFAVAGFFAALLTTDELPAALFGLSLFFVLLWQSPKWTLLCFVPAALIPLGAYFWTTYLQTGGWKPFYLYYGTEKYEYVFEGEPSYWTNPTGLDASRDSFPQYLLHCTIGHHGVFSLTPMFLLTAASWLGLRKWSQPGLRWLHVMGLLLSLGILGFYLTRTDNYNYGGNTAGLRWMFWLIPFWLLGMIPVLDAWGGRRMVRAVATALLSISVFSAFAPMDKPWQPPWLYVLMEKWNWIDYKDPKPEFGRELNTWFSTLPEATADDPQPWVELAGPDLNGQLLRLRLTAGERIETDEGTLQPITAVWNAGARDERSESFVIHVAEFQTGAPPSKFLRWPDSQFPDGPPPPAVRVAAETFLRGLPGSRSYNADRIRYRKVPLRPKEAFRAFHAASRVKESVGEGDSARDYWYRCDIWLSDAVPFGVVDVTFEVKDARTDEVVSRRVLQAVGASRIMAPREDADDQR